MCVFALLRAVILIILMDREIFTLTSFALFRMTAFGDSPPTVFALTPVIKSLVSQLKSLENNDYTF